MMKALNEMIWPLIDPINASTKSSSKLTAATHTAAPANVYTRRGALVGDRKKPLIQRLPMYSVFMRPCYHECVRLYEGLLCRAQYYIRAYITHRIYAI